MKHLSDLGRKILKAHKPGMRAYLLTEVGLDHSSEAIVQADEAYSELESRGFVERVRFQTIMPFHGCSPKNPFRLTEAGLQAQENA